jgi:hypothetical protein
MPLHSAFSCGFKLRKTLEKLWKTIFNSNMVNLFFPGESFGINFAGFDGIVECAWKATEYSHLTLPSQVPNQKGKNLM